MSESIHKKNPIHLFFMTFLLLVLVGCSAPSTSNKNGEQTDQSANKTTKTVTDFAGREISFDKVPTRIVSLAQADMEIVHALGGEIVGRPTVSAHVDLGELIKIEEVGTAHEADFEKIVSLKPDLVIGHAGLNMKDVGTAESLGLKLMLTKGNSYEEIIGVIRMYGNVLERSSEAEELIASIDARKAALPILNEKVKALVVFGSTESFMAALPSSLAGNLLEVVGGTNIASELPSIERYPDYAQISMERVLNANPDVIYFIAHGDTEAVKAKFETELQSNPAWKNLNALKNDQLIILPPHLFGSNPGPRIADSLEFLSQSLAEVSMK